MTASKIIDLQVAAYNSQDIDLLCSYFSDNIEVSTFGKIRPPTIGIQNMKTMYENLFKMFPRNHCEILSRIENGPYVVDQEFITGRDPLMLDYTVIATYLVENNKIQKVWFFAEEKK